MTDAPFNLLTQAWLPVRLQSGIQAVISPAQLTDGLADDPVVALDWPRPDFRVAGLELLIGLLALACPPQDDEDWLAGWQAPPGPEALAASFAPLAHAFHLDGPGPRFLQDLEDLPGEAEDPALLLIDRAGASELHAKPAPPLALARGTAAIALHTLQSWAPEGGRGHFTGLRGGGPLVTLVRPGTRRSLWHLLWANMPLLPRPEVADLPAILPWLSPTPEGATRRLGMDTHPLQAFFGMPRRIRLDLEPAGGRACGLTGVADPLLVVGRRQRPNGIRYQLGARTHPLTPFRQDRASREYLTIKPQPGGIGYRHWLGLVVAETEGALTPAPCVNDWRMRVRDAGEEGTRLLAAGYDMKQMKSRAFVEREMPLPGGDAAAMQRADEMAQRLVRSAAQVGDLLRRSLRNALFSPGSSVKDGTILTLGRERLWEATEPAFFAAIAAVARDAARLEPLLAEWMRLLRHRALAIFDALAPLPFDGGSATRRHAKARRLLGAALAGHGKEGAALFALLGQPPPKQKAPTGAKEAA